jgi:hypothetical protein
MKREQGKVDQEWRRGNTESDKVKLSPGMPPRRTAHLRGVNVNRLAMAVFGFWQI